MALQGRKPAPAPLKLLKGRSPGRDSGGRRVKAPPAFVRTAPEAPTWLSREAKAEWRRVVPELERLKLVKCPSRGALSAYCVSWDVFVSAYRAMQKVVVDPKASPLDRGRAIAAIAAAQKDLRAWCAEFGLTPSSEGRVTVSEAGDGEEDDAIL